MRPSLFLHVVSIEARTRISYRADFWINSLVGFAAQFGLAYFLWHAMFRESGAARIGGYDLNGMLLYYVAVILFGKVVRGPEFAGGVSQDIYEGGLNRYLVFPTNYLFFKYAQSLGSLAPAFLQLALFGLCVPLLLPGAAQAVDLAAVPLALLALGLGHLLYFVMSFPVQSVAFWADNVWSLSVVQRFVSTLLGGAMLPLTLFPEGARDVLYWLPFRMLYDVPVNTLLGRVSPTAWLEAMALGVVWVLLLGGVARWVWGRGDLRYSGIGI